jgi:hypothetical protein
MHLKRICAVVLVGLVMGTLQAVTVSSPAEAAKRFTPQPGVTFNSPLGNAGQRRAIFNKIVNSIRATPRGEQIHIMSWNILSREAVDALLRAQKRKVRVRVLMSRSNTTEIDNQPFARLKKGLRKGNKRKPPEKRSWARLCSKSCRGKAGSAHSKFFLYSKAGRARHVLIQGSANLTVASTTNQWNDIYTSTRRREPYMFALNVFRQMAKDRPVSPAQVRWSGGPDRLIFFPQGGRPDPVMQLLNKVRCMGATNTASGRTRIRIAPDVIRESRGMKLGLKIRELWRNGCDIRVGYTVVGRDVGRAMRAPGPRGPVPMRHLVQDRDGDGQFDNYFHLKTMTIVGRVGRDRSNYVTLNGSANWSSGGARSDENIGISWRKGTTLKVEKHLNFWYNSPAFRQTTTSTAFARQATADGRMVDGLLFGTGPINGVDPYAHVDMD